jgi:hypothetical protein
MGQGFIEAPPFTKRTPSFVAEARAVSQGFPKATARLKSHRDG